MQSFDVVVIGGGNTGLAVANRVSMAGRSVALVDPGPVGGLCSLAGCNPKKVFVRAAEVLDEVRRSGQHGVQTGSVRMNWERVWRRKHSFTDPVPESTERGLADKGVARIREMARFTSPQNLRAGEEEVQAGAFVIATGSTPRPLNIPGSELVKTTDDILELRQPPERMVVIGAGVVSFEFSHVFARLGTRVSILMRSGRALAGFDDDFSGRAVEFARTLGIEFIEEASVTAVRQSGEEMRVEFGVSGETHRREADFVLNAAGRIPAVAALNLQAAGVEVSPRGIVVDAFLRSTTNRRVFAGGDVHGRLQLSPVASYEGRVIARNILEGDVEKADYSVIPQAIYTTPPLAAVGLTESEARRRGLNIEVADNDMKSWKVYAIAGEDVAHAKVIAERGSGRILGAQLFGAGAGDNIHFFALAIRCGVTSTQLKEFVYAYPTFASAVASVVP